MLSVSSVKKLACILSPNLESSTSQNKELLLGITAVGTVVTFTDLAFVFEPTIFFFSGAIVFLVVDTVVFRPGMSMAVAGLLVVESVGSFFLVRSAKRIRPCPRRARVDRVFLDLYRRRDSSHFSPVLPNLLCAKYISVFKWISIIS